MKIYFHRFTLHPKRALNAFEGISPKEGVFLKAEGAKGTGFWEYFPHPLLGDDDVDTFLSKFPNLKGDAALKAFSALTSPLKLKDYGRVNCHQLWLKEDLVQSNVVKYKLEHQQDFDFLKLLQQGVTLRLDANGIFNKQEWDIFEKKIPPHLLPLIEYVEDPCRDLDWSSVSLPTASDFISGTPAKVKIYKPYRETYPKDNSKVIFSCPMGHLLGSYLTYLEVMRQGQDNQVHGLLAPDLYEEVPELFEGSYELGFKPKLNLMRSWLSMISLEKWKVLCSI